MFNLPDSVQMGVDVIRYLSEQDTEENVGMKELTAATGYKTHTLSKVCQELRRAGILGSSRGPKGGFVLLADPRELTVLDIAALFDSFVVVPQNLIVARIHETLQGMRLKNFQEDN